MKVRFAEAALADLEAIEVYITEQRDSATAVAYVADIVAHCESLCNFPSRGRARDDIRPGIRALLFKRRMIILYRVEPETVRILGIVHGARSFEALNLGD